MSTPFSEAIRAKDSRGMHLITPRMTAVDCEDALAYLEKAHPGRRSQIRAIKARLNWLRDQPDMAKNVKGERHE